MAGQQIEEEDRNESKDDSDDEEEGDDKKYVEKFNVFQGSSGDSRDCSDEHSDVREREKDEATDDTEEVQVLEYGKPELLPR